MVEYEDLTKIAKDILVKSGLYGVADLRITYSQKLAKEWKIQIAFTKPGDFYDRSAILRIDAESGEVLFFREGHVWK